MSSHQAPSPLAANALLQVQRCFVKLLAASQAPPSTQHHPASHLGGNGGKVWVLHHHGALLQWLRAQAGLPQCWLCPLVVPCWVGKAASTQHKSAAIEHHRNTFFFFSDECPGLEKRIRRSRFRVTAHLTRDGLSPLIYCWSCPNQLKVSQ